MKFQAGNYTSHLEIFFWSRPIAIRVIWTTCILMACNEMSRTILLIWNKLKITKSETLVF